MLADFERLAAVLEQLPEKRLAIAFSGGVDSTTLARAAEVVLGGSRILLLFADSCFAARSERAFALEWARARRLECLAVPVEPLSDERIASNPKERCYFCKKLIFGALLKEARARGFAVLTDGANLDDRTDYRPGARAADELGVRHLLVEAGFDKAAIRDLAHDFALPNAQAPAAACLASRIPAGTAITAAMLDAVDRFEAALQRMGFAGVRVRHYGRLAKLEVPEAQLEKLLTMRKAVANEGHGVGFTAVAMDLEGYRRGAVNGVESERLK